MSGRAMPAKMVRRTRRWSSSVRGDIGTSRASCAITMPSVTNCGAKAPGGRSSLQRKKSRRATGSWLASVSTLLNAILPMGARRSTAVRMPSSALGSSSGSGPRTGWPGPSWLMEMEKPSFSSHSTFSRSSRLPLVGIQKRAFGHIARMASATRLIFFQ